MGMVVDVSRAATRRACRVFFFPIRGNHRPARCRLALSRWFLCGPTDGHGHFAVTDPRGVSSPTPGQAGQSAKVILEFLYAELAEELLGCCRITLANCIDDDLLVHKSGLPDALATGKRCHIAADVIDPPIQFT